MNPLEKYFQNLREIKSTGAGLPETSFYGALETLLNEIGKLVKPRVRCVINIQNRGAGIPDGGLFTENQFQRISSKKPLTGQLPERGVIEIKPTSEDAWVTASGDQVSRYWGKYGLVLVTNYRDFVLIGKDSQGKVETLETYRLSDTETNFWSMVAHPRSAATQHETSFIEYLKRVMLHAAPISSPEDVAWFLASYARDARARIEIAKLSALSLLRESLENVLGLKFVGKKGEHFFRSTLIQTLFYGIFSAWVLWSKERPQDDNSTLFDWRTAAWSLKVPMVRTLFAQIATPKLRTFGLVEPLDWAAAVLNRVERPQFFKIFDQGWAVQYFYEPFLRHFDPELQKQLGVWYTPPEIVKYMVARIDQVLQQELGVPDGLADPRVFVLDPCCGTGAYLTEVIRHVASTIEKKHGDALAPQEIKKAVIERVFGFEILPAPFVISHLQVNVLLQQLQAPLVKLERAPIYLTNSLTGWTPPVEAKQQLLFPEFEEERTAADGVKRNKPILVVLGNPPYNAFAGVSSAEEQNVVDLYKEGLNKPTNEGGWGIKKFNLDDLYVRFFRIAERRIVEGKPGYGIVSYISNFSYLKRDSFVVMRKRFYDEFDSIWIDCMNGDSRETGKLTPDGKPDPSVFSTEYHPVGIRVGTAISLFVRKPERNDVPNVYYRDFWGINKRADLLNNLEAEKPDNKYVQIKPSKQNRYLFRPSTESEEYQTWPRLIDLCKEPPINGLMEKRGGSLIDIDRKRLEVRMKNYFDPQVDWEALKLQGVGLTRNAAGFDAKAARIKITAAEKYDADRVVRYALRPFDNRWCYYSGTSPLWNRSRPKLWVQYEKGNSFLMSRRAGVASPEGTPFFFTSLLGDNDFLRGHAYYFPTKYYVEKQKEKKLFSHEENSSDWIANLSTTAMKYLSKLGIDSTSADFADYIWMHALAIGFSPEYLDENADGIRRDWPRIPFPNSKELMLSSAKLGRVLAALLDSKLIDGVTSGEIRKELGIIGSVKKADGSALDLEMGDLNLTAEWGNMSKNRVVMPGKGRVVIRDYSSEEMKFISEGASAHGLRVDQLVRLLGLKTVDVYLNDKVFWKCIPENVWNYTIGGYQVIKKWLSYRQYEILGRGLHIDEVRKITNISRRIAAIVTLYPSLDKNYELVKSNTYSDSFQANANYPKKL